MKVELRAITLGRKRVGRIVGSCRCPDEVISDELAQNARSWEALRRLGVRPGAKLPLVFLFETAGPEADRELAQFLRRQAGYRVVIDEDGLTGWTPPLALDRPALDDWVRMMLYAGYEHGGCGFSGWTAIVDCSCEDAARAAAEESVSERKTLSASAG
jgi:hypothetical protein